MRKKSQIDALFPKIRQKILAITLLDPQRWWYLSDLARHLTVSPSSLQREINSLTRAEILVRRRDGKQVYFRPNPNCPFLSELQGLLIKTAGLVDVLRKNLTPFSQSIKCAFIYGSIARAEELSESDVDVLIIGRIGLSELVPAFRKTEQTLHRQVNPIIYSPIEFSKKLKGKQHFLLSVLEGKKLFIIGNENDLEAASKG